MDVDRDYVVDIMKTMYQFSRDKLFTDFKLRAGGRTAHCHQGIISSKSSYFHALCSSGVREAMLDHPISKEEDSQVLDAVLQFLYLGNCNITTHNVTSLLLAADFVKLTELKNKCGEYMATKLTTGNLLTYHKLAKQTRLSELCDECMRLSKNKFSEVARADWILSLTADELHDFLGDDQLNVKDEDEVLAVLERYLKHCQEANAVLEQIFPCIKIQFCSPTTLESMSKDTAVMPLLRLKISEHLLHGFHGEGTARPSYSAACRSRQETAALSRKLPPPGTLGITAVGKPVTPTTSTSGTSAKPEASKAGKHSKMGTTKTLHTIPKPSTSAELPEDCQEEILIVGGFEADGHWHKNTIFPDQGTAGSMVATEKIRIDSIYYSACANKVSLIFSGGHDVSNERSISSILLYNINGNTWIDFPDLPHHVELHGSDLMDGNLYTIGGCYREKGKIKHRYATVHKLHIQSASWFACPGLPEPVDQPGIAIVEDDILVIGGRTDDGYSTQTCRYNTTTNKMITCQPMPRADCVYRSTVAVDQRVYILSRTQFRSYDVRLDQWSRLSMPAKSSNSPALVLKQHTLIAMGGYDEDWKKPNDRVQVYDTRNNTWSLEDRTMPLKLCDHWAFVTKLRK